MQAEDLFTLTDIFSANGDWKDDRYDIANRSGLTGIGTVMNNCDESQANKLELRLAGAFTTLKMIAGQDNASASSDEALVVKVIANGKQIDTRHIPFNKLQTFREDITGVNALQNRGFSGRCAVSVIY